MSRGGASRARRCAPTSLIEQLGRRSAVGVAIQLKSVHRRRRARQQPRGDDACAPPLGAVKLPAWFSDNMVLQPHRDQSAVALLPLRAQSGWSAIRRSRSTRRSRSASPSRRRGPSVTPTTPRRRRLLLQRPEQHGLSAAPRRDGGGGDDLESPQLPLLRARAQHVADADFSGNGRSSSSSLSAATAPAEAAGDSKAAVCYMTVRDIAKLHTGDRPIALIQSAERVELGRGRHRRPARGRAARRTNSRCSTMRWSRRGTVLDPRDALFTANANELHNQSAPTTRTLTSDERAGASGKLDFAVRARRRRRSTVDGGVRTSPAARRSESPIGGGARRRRHPRPCRHPDLGSSAWADHPPNKNEIARRLALQSSTSHTHSDVGVQRAGARRRQR